MVAGAEEEPGEEEKGDGAQVEQQHQWLSGGKMEECHRGRTTETQVYDFFLLSRRTEADLTLQ